jgi:hypothetical protein
MNDIDWLSACQDCSGCFVNVQVKAQPFGVASRQCADWIDGYKLNAWYLVLDTGSLQKRNGPYTVIQGQSFDQFVGPMELTAPLRLIDKHMCGSKENGQRRRPRRRQGAVGAMWHADRRSISRECIQLTILYTIPQTITTQKACWGSTVLDPPGPWIWPWSAGWQSATPTILDGVCSINVMMAERPAKRRVAHDLLSRTALNAGKAPVHLSPVPVLGSSPDHGDY